MEFIEIAIPQAPSYRASEIVADLRNAAEELFHSMKVVGYWDAPTADHLCPLALMQMGCPHVQTAGSGDTPCAITLDAYRETVEHERSGALELHFTHADVRVFLS